MHKLIENDSALEALLVAQAGANVVAVDTEFMRRDTFYPQAGLLQLCFDGEPDTAWLIDPLLLESTQAIVRLFEDSEVTKVLHSGSEDLEVFQKWLGCQPTPLFDTQRAAAYLGLGFGLGYRALVEQLLGHEIPKDETRSDWLARPLSDAQLEYAALDVVPLLEIYQRIAKKLAALGRYDWVLEDGENAAGNARAQPVYDLGRFKNSWKLAPRQLALLVALRDWRDQRARDFDKPRAWILRDSACMEIVRRRPSSIAELRDLPDLPPSVVRKQGEALLALVRESEALPEQELPASLPAPLNAAQRGVLKSLKQAGAQLAEDWQVDAAALLPSKDYELLVRDACGEAPVQPSHWQGWRRERLIQPLLKLAREALS